MKTKAVCISFPKDNVLARAYVSRMAGAISGCHFASSFIPDGGSIRVSDKERVLDQMSTFLSSISFGESVISFKDPSHFTRKLFTAIAKETPGYSLSLAFNYWQENDVLFIGMSETESRDFVANMKRVVAVIKLTEKNDIMAQREVLGGVAI